MKSLATPAFLTLLFASTSVYANGDYDLKCTLMSGDQMTLSHSKDTVYLEFLGSKDDPDEGESVIFVTTSFPDVFSLTKASIIMVHLL